MRSYRAYLISIFLAFGLTPVWAGAQVLSPPLEDALNAAGPDEKIPVIVTLADQVDVQPFENKAKGRRRAELIKALRAKADVSQAPLLAALLRNRVKGVKRFWIINGAAFQAPAEVIRKLAELPGVASVRLDASVMAPEPSPETAANPEWNITAVGAPELWALGYRGDGVVVANMDTGVDPAHPDLGGKWRGGTNSWYDPHGEHSTTPYDALGHGTQTMGVMVGGDAGGSAIGIAPGAQWIAVKIFDDQGRAALSDIHAGFQWLLDPDGDPATDDAPAVVNNSWGFDDATGSCITEFEPDIATLKALGIAVVFSGGNSGATQYTSVSPANNPGSLAVGAVDYTLTVASFSSAGPSACDNSAFPELTAPGANIRTADLTFSGVVPDSYRNVYGTSFAAPHISGILALLMEAFPDATLSQLEDALLNSAQDLGDPGPDNLYGYGFPDAAAAYGLLAASIPACTDNDGDGFYTGAGNCGPVDCDDQDSTINPAACDIKGDGIDQDCDGADRLKGKPCPAVPDSGDGGISVAVKERNCSDGIDNDLDQLIDCADPDCSKNKSCK